MSLFWRRIHRNRGKYHAAQRETNEARRHAEIHRGRWLRRVLRWPFAPFRRLLRLLRQRFRGSGRRRGRWLRRWLRKLW